MKHLLVFDIDNTEEDYSITMESISLLENGKILEFGRFRENFLEGKFYRVSMKDIQDNPRYRECPINVLDKQGERLEILSLNEIWLRYYEALDSETQNWNDNALATLNSVGIQSGDEEKRVAIPVVILGKFKKPDNITMSRFKEDIKECRVVYTIRIRVDREKICDLQYLSLFLRNFPYLVHEKRISILLLEKRAATSYFPFCDPRNIEEIRRINEAHRLFSRYLRLLAKENTGVIYAPFYELSQDDVPIRPIISPMHYKEASIGEKFFPLVEIGRDEYKILFEASSEKDDGLYAEIREKDLCRGTLDQGNRRALFQIGTNRFRNAGSQNPHDALLAFWAETAWICLRRRWQDKAGNVDIPRFQPVANAIIHAFTSEQNNWLCFAIFAFLMSEGEGDVPTTTDVPGIYRIARDLSSGLQQLIQNAIQHTDSGVCSFTFYLDEDKRQLYLYVTDLNTKNTIVENFKQRLHVEAAICRQWEKEQSGKLTGEPSLNKLVGLYDRLEKRNDLALCHFFNIFPEHDVDSKSNECNVKELWREFRQSDSTAHIGLLIFFQTIMRAEAELTLQSTQSYKASIDEGNLFVSTVEGRKADGRFLIDRNKDGSVDLHGVQKRAVPGTHYFIKVPTGRRRLIAPLGGASLSEIGKFTENYAAFAKYVDYSQKPLPLKDTLPLLLQETSKYDLTRPEEKFRLQLLWTDFWSHLLSDLDRESSETVFVWHAQGAIEDYLSVGDNIEIFLKGMFAAMTEDTPICRPVYLAITNLRRAFFICLKNVCISLSNRSFSSKIQLFFADIDCEQLVQFFGASLYEAVTNAIKLTIEHGSSLFSISDMASVCHIADLGEPAMNKDYVEVMPFDAIISTNPSVRETLFDRYMCNMAQRSLNHIGENGYKIEHTHVRLGNKVHIESFYEMSFLFYRTTIANRTAFQILRSYVGKLLEYLDQSSLQMKPLLFYSYASYSKAILTSIVEITRAYLEQKIIALNAQEKISNRTKEEVAALVKQARAQVGFASYQHNLQSESTSDSVQLYFGISKAYKGGSITDENGRLNLRGQVAVVQIVPISSTLATFGKMFSKLKENILEVSTGTLCLSANYTTMWVLDNADIDKRYTMDKLKPSAIENYYWEEADLNNQCIRVNTSDGLSELKECPSVFYSIRGKARWHHPLFCQRCFPDEDKLILEVPLVETDPTSTVPSMQIRQEMDLMQLYEAKASTESRLAYIEENNHRIQWLDGCVYYGHIKRGKNHYQYYINTQDFFYKDEVQLEIEHWLKKLREKYGSSTAKLKIIFSPEHNTNVGFAQYVNTFYFDGSAEIVSVNEDKVFRSNFICEHEMLHSTIERAYLEAGIFGDGRPVEFYFVDDTVNTGATIHKANSLLHSLLPRRYAASYPAFLFTKCFILVDRMSNESKRAYVGSGNLDDFCSFLHIDISNMRVHGDSCVGCKLQKYAKRLFKRSSSRITADYWAKKHGQSMPIDYDNVGEMGKRKMRPHAYVRLVLSHIAQNYIFVDGIATREVGEYYDCILSLFAKLLNHKGKIDKIRLDTSHFYYDSLIDDLFCSVRRELGFYADDSTGDQEVIRLLAELLLKLLARPFFSFDYSFRMQLQSFLLILSESYLFYCLEYQEDEKTENPKDSKTWEGLTNRLRKVIPKNDLYKGFLLQQERLEKTIILARLFLGIHGNDGIKLSKFFKDVLFEAMADIRSTYLLRRSVLFRVNQFVDKYLHGSQCDSRENCPYLLDSQQCKDGQMGTCFWITYLTHIQREVDCTSDEIKTIWLEYLIISGTELKPTKNSENIIPEVDFTRTEQGSLGIKKWLTSDELPVAEELFLTTTGLEFDLAEKISQENCGVGELLRNRIQEEKWHQWIGHKNGTAKGLRAWHARLSGLSSGTGEVPQIEERYEHFLSNLREFIASLNEVNTEMFSIALLTMPQKSGKASIENLQLVYSFFGKDALANQDIRRARYIVKDRVVRAFNDKESDMYSVGILRETGYRIILSGPATEEEYRQQQKEIVFDKHHHVSGNHRKPYLVLLFDNPNISVPDDDLGRKLIPLSHVFLYISMNIPDEKRRNILPQIVMRDILIYRNRIMRLLTEDFNGDLMEKNAEFLQERAILTHERSASHASSTDDAGIMRVFGLSNFSQMQELTYPVDLKNHEIIDQKGFALRDEDELKNKYKMVFPGYSRSADLWLLLQSYVNGQIARLFSRQFNSNDEKLVKDDGIPALYLSAEDEQEDDIFKHRAEFFGDLFMLEGTQGEKQDNRFALMNKVARIRCYVSPRDRLFCKKDTGEFYNTEYIRCILLDIILSSMKYATINDSLLARVDTLMHERARNQSCSRGLAPIASHIIIFREECFLVVLNNVKSNAVNRKLEDINEEIFRRIHDVLDYGDGHMSLFTIRKFVIGLWTQEKNAPDVSFRYIRNKELIKQYGGKKFVQEHSGIIQQYDIWFETRLPIFERKMQNGSGNLLDR